MGALTCTIWFSLFTVDSSLDKQSGEHCLSGVGLGGRAVSGPLADPSSRSHLVHWSGNDGDPGSYPGSGSY